MIFIQLLPALAAGTGVYLLYSAASCRSVRQTPPANDRLKQQLQTATTGLPGRQLIAATLAAFLLGTFSAWLLFGGFLVPLLAGGLSAATPVALLQRRRQKVLEEAAEAWPRMIDEIRLLCGSLGRPIPQALLEVGRKGPRPYRQAFADAEREWLLSTDFERTVKLLRQRLADPVADVVCETLVVAHSIGGTDLDRRLAVLARDRHCELQGRKDARSKQAGVVFARRFVLVVPVGMALVGLSIGEGRAAYSTTGGQIGVAVALMVLAGCWWAAGRLIRIPGPQRVFRA